jgi:hypothetical protein
MTTEITSRQIRRKEAGETRNVIVSFADVLDEDASVNETISSITSVDGGGVTTSSPAVTAVTRNVNGIIVDAAKAITFKVSGGANGTDYIITPTVVTSGGQTLVRKLRLEVRVA